MLQYLFVIIFCLIPILGNTTETIKISELGTGTAVTNDDYLVFVDNPGGSPVTKKITVENFFGIMASLFSSEGYFYSYITTEETPGEDEQVVCWETTGGLNTVKSCGTKTTDNSTATHLLCKDDSGEIENCILSGLAISGTTSPTITVEAMPANATVNAAGEMTIDTTTDQIRWYGTEQRQLSPKLTFSVVVPSVADTDDMLIMKAPYGMTITGIHCLVSAATNAVIRLRECTSTGDCAGAGSNDIDDGDLTCDTDGESDTTISTDATIDSGDWIKLNVVSISGTPGVLTVTVTYTIVAD